MTVQRLNPPSLWEPPQDVISQVTVATGTRTVYVSGQVGVDAAGTVVAEGDHLAQARQAFTNVKLALEAVGATPADVVKMQIFVVDHDPGLVFPLFDVGKEVFGAEWPAVAGVMIPVAALALPGWLVEIDAVAVLD